MANERQLGIVFKQRCCVEVLNKSSTKYSFGKNLIRFATHCGN